MLGGGVAVVGERRCSVAAAACSRVIAKACGGSKSGAATLGGEAVVGFSGTVGAVLLRQHAAGRSRRHAADPSQERQCWGGASVHVSRQ
jgi:hypothetical protein